MVRKIENFTKVDWIDALEREDTKEKANAYLQIIPTCVFHNFTSEELYDILEKVENTFIIDDFIEEIIKRKKDYYLFLKKNREEERFDENIEKYILDILFKNSTMIKIGKGDLIENTILYGLEENQILKNINVILRTSIENIRISLIKELPRYPKLFFYFKDITFALIEKILPIEDVFPYIKQMIENGYENIVEENEEAIIARLTNIETEILQKERLMIPIKVVIKELLEKTNTKMEDIEYQKSGSYFDCYKIGNFVIKSGTRINKKIPYHPRFLRPFLSKEMLENHFLEVYKYVDTQTKITKEDIYTIYKDLREDGIIWTIQE